MKFNIGYVSGSKKFFHPRPETIKSHRLPDGSLIPTVESSRQLAAAGLGTSSIEPTAKLWLPQEPLTAGEKRYVAAGEDEGIDMAYKCRIRKPWYRVPGVRVPDVLLTAFSDRPRLYLNDAQWVSSNSVLGGFLSSDERAQDFVNSWYSPLTLLSTELQIHALGGGVMIAVPKEADSVLVLTPEATLTIDPQRIDKALRSGDAVAAYSLGNASVEKLVGSEGVNALHEGTELLTKWRKAQS